ncbi:MAG: YHS domain-containing protein [Chloroflexi bacterium]|nr:YHS domain-containing protein [Chloroflexota bacterium]
MVGRLVNLLKKSDAAEDPVCHMQVDMKNPRGGTHEHEGKTYYFCGPGCRVAFSKDPKSYLSGEKRVDM